MPVRHVEQVDTVFTWLNAVATISNLLNFDMASTQEQPLITGDVYCTKAPSMWLLFNMVRESLRQVKSTMHVSVFNKAFSRAKDMIYSKLNNTHIRYHFS